MNWCLCQACGKDKIGLRKGGGRVCNSGRGESWGCGCVDYQGNDSTASFFLQGASAGFRNPEVQTTSL